MWYQGKYSAAVAHFQKYIAPTCATSATSQIDNYSKHYAIPPHYVIGRGSKTSDQNLV